MKRLHYLFLALTILWMSVIFIFSSQTGETSQNTSSGIVDVIIDIFISDFDYYSTDKQTQISETISLIIRKGAHFTEYAILGFFCLFTLITYSLSKILSPNEYVAIFKATRARLGIYSGICSCIYAISDELHQGFVADRSPAVFDVLIDTAGGFAGAIVACILIYVYLRKKTKQ